MEKIFKSFHISLHSFSKRCYRLYFVIIFLIFSQNQESFSQQVTASAKADTNAILIGNQFILKLEVTHPSNVPAMWPVVADTFSLMEVVNRSSIDTTRDPSSNSITTRQQFVITSFDSGYHVIPPFVFKYRLPGDTSLLTAETDPLLIAVNSIPVDTTRAIKDIKGQVIIPFSWQDALPYIFGILLVALLAFLIYRYVQKRKSRIKVPVVQVVRRPAHEIALEELKALDESKLWQNGNYKAYYTSLSDIIRTFIQNRWSIAAMEMTTDEIVKLKLIADQEPEVFSKLKYLLELSDLVKFAKVIPVVYENEQCMQNAVAFVDANKPQIQRKEAEV